MRKYLTLGLYALFVAPAFIALGLIEHQSARAQATDSVNVNVPYTVAPGAVTIAGKVINVPSSGTTTPPPVTNPPPTSSGGCARPQGNTGSGYFVACGRLNAANGTEYRIRGVNRVHYDQANGIAGAALAKANALRTSYYPWGGAIPGVSQTNQGVALKLLTIGGYWAVSSGCANTQQQLDASVKAWIDDYSTWKAVDDRFVLNISNEWGKDNSTEWRDAYIAAIQKLRAVGYKAVIMVDSGGCGQDPLDLVNYAAAVAAADPQKNVIFSYHQYGNLNQARMHALFPQLASMSKANPALAFVVGEFGPCCGLNGQQVTPEDIIDSAEGAKIGWLAWAWDDNNLGNCRSDDKWFSMTVNCSSYSGKSSELTKFGNIIVGKLAQYQGK